MGDGFLNGAIREVSSNLDTLLAQLPIIRDGINADYFRQLITYIESQETLLKYYSASGISSDVTAETISFSE